MIYRMYACMHACMYVCIYLYTCIYIYIYIYICMYVHRRQEKRVRYIFCMYIYLGYLSIVQLDVYIQRNGVRTVAAKSTVISRLLSTESFRNVGLTHDKNGK